MVFTISYCGTYAIRKLFHKYAIKQKVKTKLQSFKKGFGKRFKRRFKRRRKKSNTLDQVNRVRGGSSEIMYYETDEFGLSNITMDSGLSKVLRQYSPTSLPLSKNNRYIKTIIRQCLKPNSYFRVTDQRIIKIIQEMIPLSILEKTRVVSTTRVISYDLFVLAMVKLFSNIPVETTKYAGWGSFVQGLIRDWGVLAFGILGGILGGLALGLNAGFGEFFLGGVGAGVSSYGLAETATRLAVHCPRYVTELPEAVVPPLLPNGDWACDPLPLIDNTDLKASPFVTNKPSKLDLFVSTSPDPEHYLHQQIAKDLNIETLDGYIKYYKQVNGENRLDWCRNITKNRPVEKIDSPFIPLHTRTKTIADVVKYDDTATRRVARNIIDSIKKEDIMQKVIETSFE